MKALIHGKEFAERAGWPRNSAIQPTLGADSPFSELHSQLRGPAAEAQCCAALRLTRLILIFVFVFVPSAVAQTAKSNRCVNPEEPGMGEEC
jgi:hypothetical protein